MDFALRLYNFALATQKFHMDKMAEMNASIAVRPSKIPFGPAALEFIETLLDLAETEVFNFKVIPCYYHVNS